MRIAYTTTLDARDVHSWSGTPYYMSKGLADDGMAVTHIGPLTRKLPPFYKLTRAWKKYVRGQEESTRYNLFAAKKYSAQVAQQLKTVSADAIMSPLVNPIAYLDCIQPIILWTDALHASLLGFYSNFSKREAPPSQQGNAITSACLSRCRLAIFSSDWAAHEAMQRYDLDATKTRVIPFGANLDAPPALNEVKTIVKNRSGKTIKLLFLAKEWERKGGDIVVAVANALHQAGHAVQLTIVGYTPTHLAPLPAYILCLGFVSKQTAEGKAIIRALMAETHFLFVPSRAEAYGIVFCEANAFGVPCLTTDVGGIPTVVKDQINGMKFPLQASTQAYCDYIVDLMQDTVRYQALALSSYHEYETRLNWKVAAQQARKMMADII